MLIDLSNEDAPIDDSVLCVCIRVSIRILAIIRNCSSFLSKISTDRRCTILSLSWIIFSVSGGERYKRESSANDISGAALRIDDDHPLSHVSYG